MSHTPLAFMSYVRSDDAHENGRLTQFCERLSGEVKMQGGETFPIFQDRNDIGWGQQWEQRIKESLNAVTFLIPIITPSFFKSQPCCDELHLFLEREQELGRGDLILPLYYVDCPLLNDAQKRAGNALVEVIAGRNFTDWRELRFEPFTTPQVGKTLAAMAKQIIVAMERGHAPPTSRKAPMPPRNPVEENLAMREVSAAMRAPQHKSEPPTRIVDALHRGDHATVAAALQAAQPGDRILVRPGLYREALIIDKPVEIIGDGAAGEVVIVSEIENKHTILFRANMGRIANLTLHRTGGEQVCCIYITQGRLEVEDCDIMCSGGSGVVVVGGADPRLRRNRIHNCGKNGIVVSGKGIGTFEDNEIYANTHWGVFITDEAHPTLRRNRIGENGFRAITISKGGYGIFEDNDLRGNANGAWTIAPDCLSKMVRRNNLEQG
ncbi:MAG: right-handed parallel beta-helix repeat-containing protein [Sulfuricellaceae bacterium]